MCGMGLCRSSAASPVFARYLAMSASMARSLGCAAPQQQHQQQPEQAEDGTCTAPQILYCL